MTVALSWTST